MSILVAADGTEIFYKDWGQGPPVIFIHGWPLTADMWEYQANKIASQGFRCISYDRRGFGRSGQPWTGYDYDTLSDDLATLIKALNLNSVTLVGFSMGGGEVARYMSRHAGSQVSKCILVSSVTPFLKITSDNPDGVDAGVFDDMITALERDRPAFLAGFGKKFFGAAAANGTVSDALLSWAQNLALQASPAATIACVRSFSHTDFRPDLKAIKTPTLIIHGDADATVPIKASSHRTVDLIKGSRLIEYAGASHGLFYTEKDRLNADLVAFMQSR
jgi:non-heme chloroperoxidase